MRRSPLRDAILGVALPNGKKVFKNGFDLAEVIADDQDNNLTSNADTINGRLSAIFLGRQSLSEEVMNAILAATRTRTAHLTERQRSTILSAVEPALQAARDQPSTRSMWDNSADLRADPPWPGDLWVFVSIPQSEDAKRVASSLAPVLKTLTCGHLHGHPARSSEAVHDRVTLIVPSVDQAVFLWEAVALTLAAAGVVKSPNEVTHALANANQSGLLRLLVQSFSHPLATMIIDPLGRAESYAVCGVGESIAFVSTPNVELWQLICKRIDYQCLDAMERLPVDGGQEQLRQGITLDICYRAVASNIERLVAGRF